MPFAAFAVFLLSHAIPARPAVRAGLIARLGEVGRMVVLRRRLQKDGQDVPISTMTATVVMEQLVLGITLAVLLVAMVFTVDGVPAWARVVHAYEGTTG